MNEAVPVKAPRFSPYPEYCDSGVNGIAAIPRHWKAKPLKFALTISGEVLPEDTPPEFAFRYVDISGVDSRGQVVATEELTFDKAPSRARRVVRSGDTIISTVRTYLKAIAFFPKVPEPIIASTGFAVLRPRREWNPSFLRYAIQAGYFLDSVVSNSEGIGYPAITPSKLACLPVVVPPLAEQGTIAAFLDRETTKIDALIAKKERLIELLQEKRTALITHTVAKGLDPGVPMRDSEIEWLGTIPAGWRVSRIKNLATFVTSGSRGWAEYYAEEGAIFLRIGNLRSGAIDLDLDEIQRVQPPHGSEGERTRVRTGDLLISITALIGAVAVVPAGMPESFVSQHLALVRLSDANVNSRWLAYYIASRLGQQQLLSTLYGGTKDGLGLEDIRSVVVVLPPRDEQRRIAMHLDDISKRAEVLVAKIRQGIDRLKEYRTALISAAVTGKIDVRGTVAA